LMEPGQGPGQRFEQTDAQGFALEAQRQRRAQRETGGLKQVENGTGILIGDAQHFEGETLILEAAHASLPEKCHWGVIEWTIGLVVHAVGGIQPTIRWSMIIDFI
jgi:hypothetical protein